MAGDYRVDTLALPETLGLVHELLDRVRAERPDVAATDLMLLETAVIEIATNVVEHGRPPGAVHYSFTLEVRNDQLLGRLHDEGPPLPESERPMPDTDSEDGRGLAIARVALDDLDYRRVDGHNEWTMVRRRR